LPIEAAMYAINMPAAYFRKNFGFMYWKDFDEKLWNKIRDEADNSICEFNYTIYGSDISFRYIKDAKNNVKKMGLEKWIKLSIESFEDTEPQSVPSLVIINPPYGERMELEEIENFYQRAGSVFKKKYVMCIAWVITSNKDAMKMFGLRPTKKIKVFNAALECIFYKYELYEGSKKQKQEIGN
jgi:putative N6-adenine-specific DNA methylase